MRTTTALFLATAGLVNICTADWTWYASSCATGLDYNSDGFSDTSIATAGQGNCGGWATDDIPAYPPDDNTYQSTNPCDESNPGTLAFNYINDGGSGYNIFLIADGSQIGNCQLWVGDNPFGDCEAAEYSCSTQSTWTCTSSYCN